MHVSRFSVVSVLLVALTVAGLVVVAAQAPRQDAHAVVVQSGDAPVVRALSFLGEGGRIGVTVKDLEAVQQKPAGASRGALVEDVVADGPAAKAGVKAGDVITAFDGERVRSARHLSRLVTETPEGRSVTLSLLRDGKSLDVSVAPGAVAGHFMAGPEEMAFVREHWNPQVEDQIRKELEIAREKMDKAGQAMKERGFAWKVSPEFDLEHSGPSAFSWVMRGPRLGVGIQDLTPELAEYFGVKDGVLVTSVTADSPAARAGIKAGDVITAVDGKTIEDSGDLRRATWENEEARELTLGVVRDKKTLSVKVAVEPPAERVRAKRAIRT
jgi:serine protease Do